jgi:[ribosomal protein S18]-alanine N-acetyltransferase
VGRAQASRRPRVRARIAASPLYSRRGLPEGVCLRGVFAETAGIEDAPALAEIEARWVGSGWSQSAFEREIQATSSRLVVLRAPLAAAAGQIAAYCAFRVVADEMELLSLAVTPDWRRQGLGRWLTRMAFASGAQDGARTAFLEVRAGNAPARQLYASLGLQETGRRVRYYKDPVEDALVLTRVLPLGGDTRNS